MATAITVGDILTRLKQRADIEKSGSAGVIGDSEGIKLIQLGAAQLQNLVINTSENWLGKTAQFSTITNQQVYPYASIGVPDLYKPLAIGLISSSNPDAWEPLDAFDFVNMNSGGSSGFFQFTNGMNCGLQYMFFADAIELRTPKSVQLIGLRYIPLAPQFATLGDELPSWIKPGWEEYLVAFGAWMAGIKMQDNVQSHKEVWNMISAQIASFANTLDKFRPHMVIRTHDMARNRYGTWGGNY